MKEPNCCQNPSWRTELDLGSAGGFEFILGQCAACGADWMNVFCVATSITGYEMVSASDVERLKAIQDWRELKAFMRQWGDAHL